MNFKNKVIIYLKIYNLLILEKTIEIKKNN